MAAVIEKLKRDFAKHKAKAIVLGILTLVMAVFVVKGVFEMAPRAATAGLQVGSTTVMEPPVIGAMQQDTEARIRQGSELWRVLREQRGVQPTEAFSFDAAYFTPDPSRRIAAVPDPDTHVDSHPVTPVTNEEAERRIKIAAIREQARALSVKSTVVGGMKPIAVINDRILSVGDRVLGFEIIAIRAREVEFKKDDVTLAVKMADDARSQ